jgi:hypothetical protein
VESPLMPAQGLLWSKAGASGKQSGKGLEEGMVPMGKNKGTQQREDVWHPLSPGRPQFPAGHCLL